MNKKEVKELTKALSQAINISDELDLEYGDIFFEAIVAINEYYGIDD